MHHLRLPATTITLTQATILFTCMGYDNDLGEKGAFTLLLPVLL
jgi:hypothetical protein